MLYSTVLYSVQCTVYSVQWSLIFSILSLSDPAIELERSMTDVSSILNVKIQLRSDPNFSVSSMYCMHFVDGRQ